MRITIKDGTLVFEYDIHKDKVSMTANLLAHLGWIENN